MHLCLHAQGSAGAARRCLRCHAAGRPAAHLRQRRTNWLHRECLFGPALMPPLSHLAWPIVCADEEMHLVRLVLICVLLVARASTFSGGWGGAHRRGSMCGRRLQRLHRCRVANACCMRLKQPYVPEAAVWFACPPSHPGGACSNSYPRAFTSHRHRAAAGAGAAAAASNHSAAAAASRGPGNGAAAAAAAVCAGMKHARRRLA